jgi:iron complex outermembrane receptor protein
MLGRSGLAGLALLLAGLGGAGPTKADTPADVSVDALRDLSIDQLANLPVTTVARRPQSLAEAPASVFVITADDIRRSGAASLPEALRIAPNLEVARIDTDAYAISARGFNSAESANKLLVLVDGRSVYEPIGSGVLWQQVDVALSDIDHIEVVTGPGGTLWGANAVNGVINIVTKDAAQSQGLTLVARGGDFDRNVEAAYGATLGDVAVRGSLSAFQQPDLPKAPGDTTRDGFSGLHGALRLDGGTADAGFTLAAEGYRNQIEDAGGTLEGGDLTASLRRPLGGGELSLQASGAIDDRYEPTLLERRATFDAQAQDAFTAGANEVVFGGEARVWLEDFRSFDAFHFANPDATITLGSVFAQDDLALRPDLKLTMGLKLEDNSYSGFDWMPNLRLAWRPSERAMVWSGVSRAVRTPNRIERELEAPPLLAPSPTFQSEKLWAFEAGYRGQVTDRLSFSATAYYDLYDDLRTDELTAGALPIVLRNDAEGAVYGVEAWGALDVTAWWRLKAGVTAMHRDLHVKPGHTDFAELQVAGLDPDYQAQLRSQMRLGPRVDLDAALRGVGPLTQLGIGQVVTPGYLEADVRLGWRITPRLEVAAVGLNLLHARHLEIDDSSTAPIRYVPRSAYAELRYGF